ncbi:MAG TPA: DMT family transporter [Candidatus Coprenecus stercorigallinarum]|nr:DMT family transporter [Candidatus Coprenecus stercorigallinarum]
MELKKGLYHFLAILTVTIWGATFVSTKILINNGLSPNEIFFYRFLIAYAGIWFVSPRRLFADNWRDELMMACAGLFGGSLYFLTENTALGITQASNVSFLLCGTPILTTVLIKLFFKGEKIGRMVYIGSSVALAGVAMVVFDGATTLRISPLGDFLTLAAALSWGFYNIFIRKLESRYDTVLISRKVFFYGLVTILPTFIYNPPHPAVLLSSGTAVWFSLLFLAVMASLVCFVLWNLVIKHIGVVKSSNYLYLNPVITCITSAIVLGEKITPVAVTGALCIMAGVWLSSRPRK